jgi:periplasmic protein TonB
MMFNNLIESSSHRREYKRRGSFFLLTTATYAVSLLISGVASIYAYDARLEDQIYEQVITMLPPEPAPTTPTAPKPVERPRTPENAPNVAIRQVMMAGVDRPEIPPKTISAKPNPHLPVPKSGIFIQGDHDYNPPMASGSGKTSATGGTGSGPTKPIILDEELPPQPPSQPVNRVVRTSKEILKSKAISLPKPIYPALAKQIRLQGTVNVQVLIDEKGNVISAQVLEGPPMLVPEAKKAALQARFSPTMLGDQPVKVSGVITYNFTLQQ